MMKKSKPKKLHSLRMKIVGMHLGVTLACFIMCGALFVLAVGLLVGKYVNHDLDFMLTEVADNLEQRLGYMEEVVYAVRDSGTLQRFLMKSGDKDVTITEAEIQEMAAVTDISDTGNQSGSGGPLVETIHLFRQDGDYLSDFYYMLTDSEISERNREMETIWRTYASMIADASGFKGYFCQKEGQVYMLYPILDSSMNKQGSIIFGVNPDALKEIMSGLSGYENAQWILYAGEQVLMGEYEPESKAELMSAAVRQPGQKPYIGSLSGTPYRVFSDELCMQLSVSMGIPENQAAVVLYNSLNLYVVGIVVILAAGIAGFTFFTLKLTRPIREVSEKLRQVQTEGFDTKLPDYDNKEFHEVSQTFNQMTEHINNLINQVYEKQITIKEMELKFLQSQMNPHFMFNVLNAIALQAKIDGNDEICELICTFSKLIQAKIYRSDMEKVQIRQEVEYAVYYLKIQQFRYGESLTWSVETENEEILDMMLPKLCIQLLVENAVVHGLEPKTGAGKVEVRIRQKEDSVYIEVTDDGVGFDADGEVTLPLKSEQADEKHNHVGLNNVNHIIQLMYGEEYGLKIVSRKGVGTTVRVHIPYDTGNDHDQ